jgi:hypothetical protein
LDFFKAHFEKVLVRTIFDTSNLEKNAHNRGATEIANAPFLTFIFENCWAMMLAGRIGW